MNSDTRSHLTIYKASAGSGKTFTLAVEYIKLLMQNLREYESTLAVTFTNKATEEMKMRILSQLYGLWRGLPSSADYMCEIQRDMQLGEEQIRQRAHQALYLLLHNYHYFRISTIDSFFQACLRNLARELGLNANLRVTLNSKQIVDEAVDDIIDSVADDRRLLGIVVGYMNDRIADGKQWDVIKQIKKFGKTIFLEIYKKNRNQMEAVLSDDAFFEKYKRRLIEIRDSTRRKYVETGQRVLQLVEDEGLQPFESFKGKSRSIMSYFRKLSLGKFIENDVYNKTVEKCMDSASEWVKEGSEDYEVAMSLVISDLQQILIDTESGREEDVRQYNSAVLTLAHLDDVRMLTRIEETAARMNEELQRFVLADTQGLLHDVIADSDAPFIYEKIGSYLRHIMIDEFQDTSIVQWENFKVLLRDCMSHDGANLIVGDVKQSIYRFRSGDWRLLNDIDKQFSAKEIDFQPKRMNWRSERNVINFNNTFFSIAAEIEAEEVARFSYQGAADIKKAYSDVVQEIPEKRQPQGLVHVELYTGEELKKMEEHTLAILRELIDERGVQQRDIAILLRKGKEVRSLANYIESNSPYRMISAEAFRLDASKAVMIIINAMRLLAHPEDKMSQSMLCKECGREQVEQFLGRRQQLATMSLHDLAEETVRHFSVGAMESEGAYVTAFFDQLEKFASESVPVLEDFLRAWDDSISEQTIEPANTDGITIMTIHKSKGLEYDYVILPYCNWKHSPHSTIWVHPEEAPFSNLPMVSVEYSFSRLANSIYEKDAVEEYVQREVDELNLLYVAMTRAGRGLFVLGERVKESKKRNENAPRSFNRSFIIKEVIERLPEQIEGRAVRVSGAADESATLMMTYGTMPEPKERKAEKKVENVFDIQPEPLNVKIASFPITAKYRQSNESRRFAEDATDNTDRERYIRMGTVMHQIFSRIRTLDDVDEALSQMETEVLLYSEDMTRENITEALKDKFRQPQIQEWFSDKWTVYNECNILTKNGEYRPDRVITNGMQTIVIDFKFGKPRSQHHDQVKDYMDLLRQMGLPDVEGYLWYVNSDKIERV